ncbi:4Fe-4S binding protein [Clostridium sporogenes]|uniref:4Fe-4S dicluster domain-containing protein n=1 Tax=Clostridium botulinum TaxID=1491 RepID=A0A6M0T3I1_CLOBO|nr:4Fe-4S binding protein [Clostridium sporogenes]NFA61974.1 4Fe-4S dicluster domain-containing protein [Clostridium botulinum]NFI75028.1 4Fe-4S dicluster domain-containing protein [Clostridium sporogenes]NFL74016.1 4Fe-4S dicluster domain-containing protein [Clostridium sporogenes]NFM25952.1 4Fe-4S dicluster domain-containing protein [Clostridium sporogenes]NFP63154.1 4Fe-4S dicluster domain-containing protein [Clostridium sporogenes]
MISKDEISKLKGEGFLVQKQEGYFSVRILSRAGNFTSKQIRNLAEIADNYGRGYLGVTTRLATEIPWIKYEDIEAVKEEIISNGMVHGGTGKKVRPLVSCKGTVCIHGLYDTQKLCAQLHDEYFGYGLPSKFKITLVGCPNNCAKASINDIGIMGQAFVDFNEEKCKGCGLCTKSCRQKAITVENKKLVYKKDLCVNCGKCASVCHFNAMTIKEQGLQVFLGGRFGREYRIGNKLKRLYTEEEIPSLVQKIFDVYTEMANPGERLAKMIERVGFHKVEESILQ